MTRRRRIAMLVMLCLPAAAGWAVAPRAGWAYGDTDPTRHVSAQAADPAPGPAPDTRGHDGDGPSHTGHVHVAVPAEYRSAHVPASVWTDPHMIARGEAIYSARCAACHGAQGDGTGPAAAALPLKPPDLRARAMVDVMAGNYWFWRISEGGVVEPFRSQGSAMPAWKDLLTVEERWAVIAYLHAFSSHPGPHVTSEHPEMPVVGDEGPPPSRRPDPAGARRSATGAAGHGH